MASHYEGEFYWFGPASEVILTGSFDEWSKSIKMEKTPAGFSAKAQLPYGEKVDYKYVVDGNWQVNPDFPTTYDWKGNINNYIITPKAPEPEQEQPKSLPTPPPDVVVKPPTWPADDDPVTPINLPAAVTPMEVPRSAISAHPSLEVDAAIAREVVETLAAAMRITDETPEDDVPPKAEQMKPVVIEEIHTQAPAATTITATELVASPETISIVEAPKDSEDLKPEVIVIQAPQVVPPPVEVPAQPKEAVALDSPVKSTAPELPEAEGKPTAAWGSAPPAPAVLTPSAIPLPETPAPEKEHPAGTSHFSSTTSETKQDTKPAPPTTPKKSEERPGSVNRSSSKGSRVFSFSGRRSPNDEALSVTSTPGSSPSKAPETKGKKRSSFLGKIHEIFHPHHKEGKA